MGDDATNPKKRKTKSNIPYLNMTAAQADKRLGFRIPSLKVISVDEMLENLRNTLPDFKEAGINDMVYATISPILYDFIRMTGRESIRLRREKKITSTDGETGGKE
ncbi:hypothetical protein EV426DRAFT_702153 [Tirmania nivea]|nr:hypothetical protein EV426DRAFT_702153 [Tirmania nivea]